MTTVEPIRNKDEILNVDIENDDIMYLSTKYSYSPWMIKNFINSFGKDFTEDLIEANNEKPSIYLRTNTLKISRDELIEKLKENGLKAYKVSIIDEAIRVENLKDIENNELFKEGYKRATVKQSVSVVSQCLEKAVTIRMIFFNPCKGVVLHS